MNNTKRIFQQIAKKHLRIPTLAVRNSDQLDFHEVDVWGVASALQTAYDAGWSDALENLDVHEILAGRKQIAVIWCIEDVQAVRPDLDEEQAFAVLQEARRRHDATQGIHWETLEYSAEELFGDAPETNAAEV